MILRFCLKVMLLHFFAIKLVNASASSWAFQQIETEKAWELARGRGDRVVIAVVDTGIDRSHPAKLWVNPGESGPDAKGRDKANNKIDDDKNGFVDDVHGWNFVTNSKLISDQNGHGSHISGIISQVAPESPQMILKYYDANSSAESNVRNTLKAFLYAIQMKAQIINFSGGGPGEDRRELEILKMAEKKNILLVAAAGNDGLNTDKKKYYPANYGLRNILSVTALDQNGHIPYFGNFGFKTVHLAAPGVEIPSNLRLGSQGKMSGTSQATAFASATAALLISQSPTRLSPAVLIQRLAGSGERLPSLNGKTSSGSRLHAQRALAMKSLQESAAGFVYGNGSEWDPEIYTVSSPLLDPPAALRQSQNQK